MEFKFGTLSIYEIGSIISSKLKDSGVEQQAELCIFLDSENFRKVDEDLFYRMKSDEEEFIPSEKEIEINFEGVKIIIKEKSED